MFCSGKFLKEPFPPLNYEDFTLSINSDKGDGYHVLVVSSPAGQSEKGHHFDLPKELTRLQTIYPHHPRGVIPRETLLEKTNPIVVGQALFEALFQDEVMALFSESRGLVKGKAGLRIRIQITAGASQAEEIPWELLYDPMRRDFLCLNSSTPIVRSPLVHCSKRPLLLNAPLRLLVLFAEPLSTSPLDLDKELRQIKEVWKGLSGVEIETLKASNPQNLRDHLLEKEFNVLHYMGHGDVDKITGEGILLFEGTDGQTEPVETSALGINITGLPALHLVVLNACDTAWSHDANSLSGVAGVFLQKGIPAVVAMQSLILDKAAISFSRAFYRQLASGAPIEQAITEGRIAIKNAGAGWATPVLLLRDGALKPKRPSLNLLILIPLLALALVLTVLLMLGIVPAPTRMTHEDSALAATESLELTSIQGRPIKLSESPIRVPALISVSGNARHLERHEVEIATRLGEESSWEPRGTTRIDTAGRWRIAGVPVRQKYETGFIHYRLRAQVKSANIVSDEVRLEVESSDIRITLIGDQNRESCEASARSTLWVHGEASGVVPGEKVFVAVKAERPEGESGGFYSSEQGAVIDQGSWKNSVYVETGTSFSIWAALSSEPLDESQIPSMGQAVHCQSARR